MSSTRRKAEKSAKSAKADKSAKSAKADKAEKSLIYCLAEFDDSAKQYISQSVSKIASKIRDSLSLKEIEKYLIILIVLRDKFVDYLDRYKAVEIVNSSLNSELHCYAQSYISDEQRLNFAKFLHESYQTTCRIKAEKSADASRFEAFLRNQKRFTLHNSISVVDAIASITKSNKKLLQSFKVCRSFVKFCETLDEDDLKVIESFAFSRAK